MSRASVLSELSAAAYARHALHAEERVWVEKNCYIDLWIEPLGALKVDPVAILPFTVAVDFEGDQWTFFKPPHGELFDLYGVDVQELTVWRPLVEHALLHLSRGTLISTEADAFYLPDTSGTDYRRSHTKTTIVLNTIDVERRRLGYFHNAGYYELEGEDFEKLFRLGEPPDPEFMPLFAEIVRVDRKVVRPRAELVTLSRALLAKHWARRPTKNPVARFAQDFQEELPRLQERGLEHYHLWAFAGIRQLGAAFELSALHARWLEDPAFEPAARSFDVIASSAKTFILKAARAVNAKRAMDSASLFEGMIKAWDEGMGALGEALGA